jgi:hypothetical protein
VYIDKCFSLPYQEGLLSIVISMSVYQDFDWPYQRNCRKLQQLAVQDYVTDYRFSKYNHAGWHGIPLLGWNKLLMRLVTLQECSNTNLPSLLCLAQTLRSIELLSRARFSAEHTTLRILLSVSNYFVIIQSCCISNQSKYIIFTFYKSPMLGLSSSQISIVTVMFFRSITRRLNL